MIPDNPENSAVNTSGKNSAQNTNAPDKSSKPSGREIIGIGALVVGSILILVAFVILMILTMGDKPKSPAAPVAPLPKVETPPPAPVKPVAEVNSPSTAESKTPAVPVEAAPAPVEAAADPIQTSASDAHEPENATVAPSSEIDTLPQLITNVPLAEISDFIQSITVCGRGAGKILLLMPGQEEARAYREGDMLDGSFELTLQTIEAQRLVIADRTGNKYFKVF
jgi:hypothetical protein